MSSLDDNTFQLLLEEMKKMNKNLESTSFALNNLTMQINSQPKDENSILPPTANTEKAPITISDCSNGMQTPHNTDDSGNTVPIPHSLGYVNWDRSHDFLKEQKLVKMTILRALLTRMADTLGASQLKQLEQAQPKYDCYGRAITTGKNEDSVQEQNHFASLYENDFAVEKEVRFPLDAVYLDVNSAVIKKEIDFMNKLNVQPTNGVIERFLAMCENEMLTCDGFEKKYGLQWV